MPLSFPTAPTVEVGDRITSTQFAGIAEAFNARLRSGLADGPWRILFYFLGMLRQPRNPDAGFFAYPSMGEFFEAYQHVEPRDGTWPLAMPGEAEGANVASQMNQFVFGAEALDLDSEATRVNRFPFQVGPPQTPGEAWDVAKAQRGAFDPLTGGVACPAFDAAQSHWKVRSSRRSPHGNSFGGWMPQPDLSGSGCVGDPSEISYEYKFTSLIDASVVTYPGSCSDDPTHVAGIIDLPLAYYVILNSGQVDVYRTNEWIEGPYNGPGVLQKRANNAVERALATFTREFRGSEAQREQQTYHLQSAFDFHRFMKRQYLLAPSRGVEFGGAVTPTYPKFEGVSGDEFLLHVDSRSNRYALGTACVVAGAKITISGASNVFVLELRNGSGDVLARVTCNNGERLWFPEEAIASDVIEWRIATSNGGRVEVEMLELLDYKPQHADAALFLRVGAAWHNEPDGAGVNEPAAYQISDAYFEHGCCVNINNAAGLEESPGPVNTNAVFDAVRRLSKLIRLIRRKELTGYAVIGGQSVLWFRRTVLGLPGFAEADIWKGIVNEDEPDKNGIAHVAPVNGYTNEWLLGVEFLAYHPSDTSIWKPDAYTDYFAVGNRCMFYSPELAFDKTLRWHYSFGQSDGTGVMIAEAPTGHTYADMNASYGGSWNVNTIPCDPLDTTCIETRADFYRSCPIYKPDVEIESVTVEESGEVKVILKGRLQHHADAPESIARDTGTWDVVALEAESYRTDENGIRAYLLNNGSGRTCAILNGDAAANGAPILYGLPDNPFGTCYPRFRLTKLVPKPYDDGNDSQNAVDTKFEHDAFTQMELYLRAMCEGYVDGELSAEKACLYASSSVYDFTFENLCFQAFGGRAICAFNEEDRPDRPIGYGPMPNTLARAVTFNQIAQAVNLLTRVRVMLPGTMEVATFIAYEEKLVQALLPDGSPATCSPPDTQEVYHTGVPANPIIDYSTPSWGAGNSAVITSNAFMDGTGDGGSGLFAEKAQKEGCRFRYALADDSNLAIPEEWRSQFEDRHEFVVLIVKNYVDLIRKNVTDIGEAEDCDGVKWAIDGSHWLSWDTPPWLAETVCDILGGEFEAPPLRETDTYHGTNGATECPGGPVYRQEITVMSNKTPIFTVPLT